MNRETIKSIVQANGYLRSKLFYKGFFITNDKSVDYSIYPFYGEWESIALNGLFMLAKHSNLPHYVKITGEESLIVLLGHAYNPINGMIHEDDILTELSEASVTKESFFQKVNELTGVFCILWIQNQQLIFLNDAVGLMSVFYAQSGQFVYASSHVNLIGDLLGLSEDPDVTRLKKCKTFSYFGNQLPGNITSYREIKRQNPNHYTIFDGTIRQIRFYTPHTIGGSFESIVDKTSQLLQKSMAQIAQKWDRPAISLTGGCDSKTTLACTSEVYDKYTYFSYDSQENELPDALAASKICEALELPHVLYNIPYDDRDIADVEGIRCILMWNGGNVRLNNANDVRKRAYLDKIDDFDVEVKSWVSEIGRARYTKRYNGRRNFGKKPTPRKCTTFYKFLLFDRKAVKISDRCFTEYLRQYYEAARENPIPWQDQFYWEWHWPSRDGICLTAEQLFSNDITVPYNNRYILELLLSVTEEIRINDLVYTEIRTRLDKRIDQAGEAIVDVNHTRKRAIYENLYYVVNNILP